MQRVALLAAVALTLFVAQAEAGLRLSSVLPMSYTQSAPVQIKVNSLTSHSKVMPMPWYSNPWCQMLPEELKAYKRKQNLGEVLWGSQIEPSLYQAQMLINNTCTALCPTITYTPEMKKLLSQRVEDNYRGNLVLDGLPGAEEGSGRQSALTSAVATGFPIGVAKKYSPTGQTLVNNHLALNVMYHEHSTQAYIAGEDEPTETYRVVGFSIAPMSIDHSKSTGCNDKLDLAEASKNPLPADADTIQWTYSVHWIESDIEWSTRWDVYMRSTKVEARIHWMSIFNSLVVVFLLTAIIALILFRLLKRDFARYNDAEAIEEERDETGWKQVHGDVFRKPDAAGLLSVYIGSGVQLLGMCFVTIVFACLGFASPANRGSLLTIAIFLFVLLGSYSGYTTARMAKMFKMKSWRIVFAVGLFFPGSMFAAYFMLNFVHWGSHAASATPIGAMLTLFALWLCVSLPLVLLGGAVGYRREAIEPPRKVNAIAKSIPPQPVYLQYPQCVLIPGILPFGSAFIESVFILSSIWQGRIYYVFGFLGLVFLILIVTCAEATIVMIYFQLVNLDYNWWWRSFFTGASYGIWFFLYCIYYYVAVLSIRSLWSSVLYFGYMLMVSYFCAVMTGTIGFCAAYTFVHKIYSSIKVD
jgi:transmembrane 9 superfamily protein 2/4